MINYEALLSLKLFRFFYRIRFHQFLHNVATGLDETETQILLLPLNEGWLEAPLRTHVSERTSNHNKPYLFSLSNSKEIVVGKKKRFTGAKCGPVSSRLFARFLSSHLSLARFLLPLHFPVMADVRENRTIAIGHEIKKEKRLLLTLYLLTYTPCAFLLGPRRALRGNFGRPIKAPELVALSTHRWQDGIILSLLVYRWR